MEIAESVNAQGYVGRCLMLKAEFVRRYSSHQPLSAETVEELELKVTAVRNNLEASITSAEMSQNSAEVFALFIPWQAR